MTSLAIDARMLKASGIGTVLTQILPRLIVHRPHWRFKLLGHPDQLAGLACCRAANVELVPFEAPIYSIREQIEFPHQAISEAQLFWAANYNIPLRWRNKLAVTIHDVAHLELRDAYGGLAKQFYAKFMFSRVCARADMIVFVSEFTRGAFSERVGTPHKLTRMIHGGVDDVWFGIDPGAGMRQRPFILFIGNVKPHKNLVRLLQAFRQVASDIPHDLVIVGKKEGFITGDNAVTAEIGSLEGRIEFTGYLPDAELRRLTAQADALVLPSLYEGFGLPPLEAMATGVPTLVSNAASLPEVCADASLYCDPLDVSSIAAGLRRIVTDQELRAELRGKGLARAQSLSWDHAAVGYLEAFEATLGITR